MNKTPLAVLAGALALVLPGAARAAPVGFNDPGGDNGVAADIGAVTVDSTADGFIGVKASVANMPQLGQPGFVIVVFDTDRNGATGSPHCSPRTRGPGAPTKTAIPTTWMPTRPLPWNWSRSWAGSMRWCARWAPAAIPRASPGCCADTSRTCG